MLLAVTRQYTVAANWDAASLLADGPVSPRASCRELPGCWGLAQPGPGPGDRGPCVKDVTPSLRGGQFVFCSVVCFHAPLFALGHFGGAFWGSPNLEGSRILDDAKMMSQRPFLPIF